MSPQTAKTQTSVPDESEEVFEEIRSKYGHVPEAFRVLAPVPRLLRARWDYQAQVTEPTDTVGETTKQAIALAVSAENGCSFCVFAHSNALDDLDVDEAEIERIKSATSDDDRLQAILEAAVAVTKDPLALADGGRQPLEDAGLGREDQLEVLEVAAYFNGMNRLLDSFDVEPPGR